MNTQRRIGLLTAIAGAALALGSLAFAGSAQAVEASNFHDVHGNITSCPAGTIEYDGQIRSGSGSTALFHWSVTHATYVTITHIDPTVTGLRAYIKGGDNYRVYDPVIDGQVMRSPTNHGGNVPTLSHWMLCSTITPVVTTTTARPTTVPEIVTTTTVPQIVTTTTVPEIVTTTTIGEPEGPTTTIAETTTTEQASEGPTTTEQASEGPTTTLAEEPLPTTGGRTSVALMLGLAMTFGGVLFTLLGRTPRES